NSRHSPRSLLPGRTAAFRPVSRGHPRRAHCRDAMLKNQGKPCLLVVDDEPDLVHSVKDLLRFEYRVLGATRAPEGLKILESDPVRVVMPARRMPEIPGVKFLAPLPPSPPDITRLLFTAYADLKAVPDAITQGSVYRYIPKPFEPQELQATLRQAVE